MFKTIIIAAVIAFAFASMNTIEISSSTDQSERTQVSSLNRGANSQLDQLAAEGF